MESDFSLSDKAYEQLEYMILLEELKGGAMYSEKQLSERLNMGRTPIREALQRLAWEQMVVIHPRRGIQIPEVSVESQLKLLEVRRPIEAECVRLAAQRVTEDQKGEMKVLADGIVSCARNHDDLAFLNYLRDIHALLVKSARNDFFIKAMRPLQGLSRRFWFLNKEPDTDHPANLHAEIMRKISEGNVDGAVQASNNLIDYLVQNAKGTLIH
ncbi:GntR family transcriptional regulator [Parendozoicomonas haliclonae]|uniref:Putative HTH-type transcriptional regulator YdfH n=1 Tax=Parendozoicomonas haliclonae TaxID=1960125 RepID=A0A1X7AJK2_9GAMM|nr:GntR family transcriptional regulator [Parendozoicomonas haliclonae]SMA46648.1 putative HTH-type transcriptional regulator YdfH [Parendozoicomonas haliclonae]